MMFPTIDSDIPENARVKKVRAADLVTIADGENGTLTMHKSLF